mmetsp:Transcript_34367/g.113745  ORF Transcript_34367/g.113745 Transcript_34367/m.113745 type:complete len:212 (+) Transcript_34367:426-1061(+)
MARVATTERQACAIASCRGGACSVRTASRAGTPGAAQPMRKRLSPMAPAPSQGATPNPKHISSKHAMPWMTAAAVPMRGKINRLASVMHDKLVGSVMTRCSVYRSPCRQPSASVSEFIKLPPPWTPKMKTNVLTQAHNSRRSRKSSRTAALGPRSSALPAASALSAALPVAGGVGASHKTLRAGKRARRIRTRSGTAGNGDRSATATMMGV